MTIFFAERRGQGRQAQFHFAAVRGLGLDPTVLGFAFFRDVHSAQALEAADDRHRHLRRELIDGMQHPVDAKPHGALLAARFDVDIAGALLEGVLEQPVDDIDDVGVVGVRFLVTGAEVEQLFEVAQVARLLIDRGGAADRLGQAIELHAQALDIHRVGDHPLDRQLEYVGQVGFPAADVRLCAGDGDGVTIDRYREDLVALGKGVGHQGCHGRHVDFQRVDAHVGLAGLLGQPQGQVLQVQALARAAEIVQVLVGNELQRMQLAIGAVASAGVERGFG